MPYFEVYWSGMGMVSSFIKEIVPKEIFTQKNTQGCFLKGVQFIE